MINRLLQSLLAPIAQGSRRRRLYKALALVWAGATVAGLLLLQLHRTYGWSTNWMFLFLLAAALAAAARILFFSRLSTPDVQTVAREIERENPELHAVLLTAVEQTPDATTGELGYLQQRVVSEALEEYQRSPWGQRVARELALARFAQWVGLACFAGVMVGLRPNFIFRPTSLFSDAAVYNGVDVTPGDIALERGSGLVVLAKFRGQLPTEAHLLVKPVNERELSVPLMKNLADPVFGGGLPAVKGDLTYRVDFGRDQTREFKVTVFDYPKLERADAHVAYPAYTGLAEKTIPDTRRVSAVEGSTLDYSFFLNKPVATAKLVAKDGSMAALTVDAKNPSVYHAGFKLDKSQRYELVLVDEAGRTNKLSSEFVLEALANRPAEVKLTLPKGDQRVSALAEINFQAEVSDDFGLKSYGIGYNLAGGETKDVVLGKDSKPHEKKTLSYVLPLESLGAQPDQVLSYYVWAEDSDSQGAVRRTVSDMYFAEIKPFDEIFRESQPGDQSESQQQQQGGQQQGGSQAEKLADIQKQIVAATWNLKRRENGAKPSDKFKADVSVVRDSQKDALDQVREMKAQPLDPKIKPYVDAAEKAMVKAGTQLGDAAVNNSLPPLTPALADEQAALQAVLKLQAREFNVSQQRGQRGQKGQQGQRGQRQASQLDLKQSDNRYENQREAAAQQTPEQKEQLQVVNRLKELAQRQQDLNNRLKELQTALQEAKTEQEREAARDRLKRLREEQQDMLADVDELRQRMDRPENQSRMSEERQQLDQTRQEVQQTADAIEKQSVPQALASGTRAQRDLQQLHDDVRKKSSAQFSEEMRQMRDDARQLAQKEDDIAKKIGELGDPKEKSLRDSDARHALAEELAQQKGGLTNLFNEMRRVSEQAEATQPLLSQQLYDTLRQATPDSLNEALDKSAELVQRGFVPKAGEFEEPARKGINDLRQAVERAAESVLGDETEALRLARQELEKLSQQLDRELAQADNRGTNRAAGSEPGKPGNPAEAGAGEPAGKPGEGQDPAAQANAAGQQPGREGQAGQRGQGSQPGRNGQNGQRGEGAGQGQQPGEQANAAGQEGQGDQPGQSGQSGQRGQGQGQRGQGQRGGNQPGGRDGQGQGQGQASAADAQGNNPGDPNSPGENGRGGRGGQRNANNGGRAGGYRQSLDDAGPGGNYVDGGVDGGNWGGPLTGADYTDWSDRLRNVEEMVDSPELRTQVARIRDRAKAVRQDFKRVGKKPDWAVVKQEISKPLAEVRARVDEEIARRSNQDALVPLDRDPVPAQYSELVRRYYEQLGKSN